MQNQLWQGFKENDMTVPIKAEKHELVDARHKQLISTPLQSAFETTYESAAKSIATSKATKREQCRYATYSAPLNIAAILEWKLREISVRQL